MKYLLGLLVLLVTSDGVLTYYLIRHGVASEVNPFLQPLVGDVGFVFLKLGGALISAVILWDVSRRYRRVALFFTSCCVVAYAAIVLWNLGVFWFSGRFLP